MGILLKIKFYNNQDQIPLRGAKTFDGSIHNFEKNLNKNIGAWEYAIVYQDGQIVHYYHESTGVVPIDKKMYIEQLKETRINLYIVPTQEYKNRTGQQRLPPVYGAKIEDMPNHYNDDVLKVIAYLNNKAIKTYQDGKFL
jgi:hypothetical protein